MHSFLSQSVAHSAATMFPRRKLALALLMAASALTLSVRAQAQNAQADSPQLGTIVVSATRTAIDLKSAPTAISVINAEDLQSMTLFTVDEALGKSVGVMNRRTKGFMETTPSLTMRGLGNSRDSLVLVDGIPQNDARNGQVNWTMIDSENIERMEVIRGPYSSLYGGNALGGVVSIFTRVPEESRLSVKIGAGGSAQSIAPEDFRDFSLAGDLRINDVLAFGINLRQRETSGYASTHVNVSNAVIAALPAGTTGWVPYTSNVGAASNLIGDMGDNWYDDNTGGLRLSYTPSDVTRLDLSFSYSDSLYGYDQPHSLLRTEGSDEPSYANVPAATWLNGALFARGGSTEQRNSGLSFQTARGAVNIKATLGHISKKTTTVIAGLTAANAGHPPISAVSFTGGDGRLAPSSDSPRTAADLQVDFPVGERHIVVMGVAAAQGEVVEQRWSLRDWSDASTRYFMASDATGRDQIHSVYIQDAWSLNSKLTAYIGARQDWWRMRGGQARSFSANGSSGSIGYEALSESVLSPKLSLVYRLSEATSLRASTGKAFRAPNLFEFFGTASLGGNIFVGNPELKPETLVSWEAGFDHSFDNGINAVMTLYRSQADDRIATQTIAGISTPQNVAEARIEGVELELKGPLPFGFSWSANYGYTDTEVIRDPNPAVIGKQLPHAPRDQYNISLDWRQRDWAITATHSYQSKRFTNVANTDVITGVPGSTDSFQLTDIKSSYTFSQSLSAALGINNLFDEQYNQFYRSPGRFWFAELRLGY